MPNRETAVSDARQQDAYPLRVAHIFLARPTSANTITIDDTHESTSTEQEKRVKREYVVIARHNKLDRLGRHMPALQLAS